MATGKKISEEEKIKRKIGLEKKVKEKQESKDKLVKQIQESSKELLIPTLKDKMQETTNYIVELLEKKGENNVNNIQIMSVIAQRSLYDISLAYNNITFTPQEIMIGFNLYLEMINKINEIKLFPPTVESFANFMGISRTTYNNWLSDPDKKDTMDYINSYLLGVLAVGGLTGETKEISSMFLQKTMGKTEVINPIVVEHKKTTDIDTINAQLQALKGEKIIEAEYEEESDE